MAPRDSRENLEGVVTEVEDQHHVDEKSIEYDPALANAADTQQLGELSVAVLPTRGSTILMRYIASIGYKQELQRHYSSVQVFAIAFSIMGLLPSISATLWFSVPAGPVGMVWVSIYLRCLSPTWFDSYRDGSLQALLFSLLDWQL
jgi:hypothetical protein